MTAIESLQEGLAGQISFKEKRPGISQIVAPVFHEDGDMIDLFLDQNSENDGLRLSDNGLTLMRLSYSFDIDTPNKQRILAKILNENGISQERGILSIAVSPQDIVSRFLHFSQVIAKVTSLQFLRRQVVTSLFYEQLGEFIRDNLKRFEPSPRYLPIKDRPELEVDWAFFAGTRPLYLFGVRESSKAKLSAISCLEFQRQDIPFRSVIVHEDFEDGLKKSDQRIITSAADKQFPSLDDFRQNGPKFFNREAAA